MRKIVDFHIHAGVYSQLRDDIQALIKTIPLEDGLDVTEIFTDKDVMEQYLRDVNVETGIVLAECGPGTNFSINSQMIADKCESSNMLIPFGSVNPTYHSDVVAEFESSVKAGCKGFKFYPADHDFDALSDEMMAIYHRCQEEGMVIMFHTGFTAQKDTEQVFCNPADFKPLLDAYPDLPVLFCHAGKPHWYKETVELMQQYPNAWIDTALVPVDIILGFTKDYPEITDRIVFGSDWPVSGNYHKLIERYEAAGFDEVMLEKIFYGNAQRLLKRLSDHQGLDGVVWGSESRKSEVSSHVS